MNVNKRYLLYTDYSRNTYETNAVVQGSVLGTISMCGTMFIFQEKCRVTVSKQDSHLPLK